MLFIYEALVHLFGNTLSYPDVAHALLRAASTLVSTLFVAADSRYVYETAD